MKISILVALIGLTSAIRLGVMTRDDGGSDDKVEHVKAEPEDADTSASK